MVYSHSSRHLKKPPRSLLKKGDRLLCPRRKRLIRSAVFGVDRAVCPLFQQAPRFITSISCEDWESPSSISRADHDFTVLCKTSRSAKRPGPQHLVAQTNVMERITTGGGQRV